MKEISKNPITIEQLSRFSGIKLKIISEYIRKGFLPYNNEDEDGKRYYDKSNASERLKKIQELKKEGFTPKEIQDFFRKKDFNEMRKELYC